MRTFSPRLRITAMFLVVLLLFSSCGSTTLIRSNPSGARVYLDQQAVGQTPYPMRDTKIVGTCTNVRLEKQGYEKLETMICRDEEADVGAIIGGIFLLVPFLWTMKYQPVHNYDLVPLEDEVKPPVPKKSTTPSQATPSKTDTTPQTDNTTNKYQKTEGVKSLIG